MGCQVPVPRKLLLKSSECQPVKISINLLGAGDSGKTTIKKQLAQVHEGRLNNDSSRSALAQIIIANILDGTLQVLSQMPTPEAKEIFRRLKLEAQKYRSFLGHDAATTILTLYSNSDFQETISKKALQVQLQDCYSVFCKKLDNYPEWGGEGWIPSIEDCISARAKTCGITQDTIHMNGGKITLEISDAGGQRAERRKWLNLIENMENIVFVVALSEYNQGCFEDPQKNRLEEALDLFRKCFAKPEMENKNVAIFFNKRDIFEEKFLVHKTPLNISGRFPDAPKGNDDIKEALNWIISLFTKIHPKTFVHVTSATCSKNLSKEFNSFCNELPALI